MEKIDQTGPMQTLMYHVVPTCFAVLPFKSDCKHKTPGFQVKWKKLDFWKIRGGRATLMVAGHIWKNLASAGQYIKALENSLGT